MVEISVGVICACLPTLPPLLRLLGHQLSKTAAFCSKYMSKDKDKDKDLPDLGFLTKQKGETPFEPNTKKTAL